MNDIYIVVDERVPPWRMHPHSQGVRPEFLETPVVDGDVLHYRIESLAYLDPFQPVDVNDPLLQGPVFGDDLLLHPYLGPGHAGGLRMLQDVPHMGSAYNSENRDDLELWPERAP